MRHEYEKLLRWIYDIPADSTTLHLTHGARADVYTNASEHLWNYEDIDKKIAAKRVEMGDNEVFPTLQEAFNAGEDTAEISISLAEAIQTQWSTNARMMKRSARNLKSSTQRNLAPSR